MAKSSENAVSVQAKVLESRGRTGARTSWHSVIIDMKLEIQAPDKEPYTAETSWLVKIFNVQHLQVNNMLSVKVDPENPEVIYPDGMGYSLYEYD